jgi:2-methylcitrate dehydratase PrpD
MNAITDIPGQGLTRKLAEQARALRLEDIPEDIRAWARQCVLDYVACTLAGAKDELTEILLAEMQEQGGKGSATIMGHGVKLPPAGARIPVQVSPARALSMRRAGSLASGS